MTSAETVTAFIEALTSGDIGAAAALCHDDLIFENVPLVPPVQHGRDVILAGLGGLVSGCTKVAFEVTLQIESGSTVTNERVDRFWFDDGQFAEVPVMARWEVSDGRISLWRDYYDMSMWDRHFTGGYYSYIARRQAGTA